MITLDDLDRVLAAMIAGRLQSLEVSEGKTRIRLKLAHASVDGRPSDEITVASRGIGRYVPTHPRSSASAPKLGERVAEGAIIGFLANDAVLLPIVVPRAGKIQAVHAQAGSLLGFGAPIATLIVDD